MNAEPNRPLRSNFQVEPRRVAVLVYPQADILNITGPLEVFMSANRLQSLVDYTDTFARYDPELIARTTGPIELTDGFRLVADRSFRDDLPHIDTLLIPGGLEIPSLFKSELIAWLRQMEPRVRRLVSICSGALLLAEAGLLDGRRATTHWASCSDMARLYPRIRVDADALFMRDGAVYTSGGGTAGIDLALCLVEEDCGDKLSRAIARGLVFFLKRPGGQSQFKGSLLSKINIGTRFDELLRWILDHLEDDLPVDSLARRAGMSSRHFTRTFRREVGAAPGRFVELARLEEARRRLDGGDAPLGTVARESGFGSVERMRRSFHRHLRIGPRDYRRLHGRRFANPQTRKT